MIIAVEGPTASGKGGLAARLAARYGLARLDTGALYRGWRYWTPATTRPTEPRQ
jgi:cytidylate kinase